MDFCLNFFLSHLAIFAAVLYIESQFYHVITLIYHDQLPRVTNIIMISMCSFVVACILAVSKSVMTRSFARNSCVLAPPTMLRSFVR